ncbi:BON1-associated protein 2 [Morella rubra]|uniref:BON1-associated protein 2 n=1 Tax=Morella rubra TaxID=262757 RepID=A0A6A1VNM8_9ROSI|nr:BON1-associated protein 2 [Morella rubra]
MTSISTYTLEIAVISGENLLENRKPVKKNAFVVIRTDSHSFFSTKMDTDGGSYPTWNEKLVVDLPMHAQFISLEVQCKTAAGNKTVGAARIPVSDFIGGYVPQSYLHFLSYRLRDSNGERNGIINISVRAKLPDYASCSSTGMGLPVAEKYFGGVVTGVPVWCTNPAQASGINDDG